MCWFKPKLLIAAYIAGSTCLLLSAAGCRPEIKETGPVLKYFDIKGYFNNQITILNRQNKPVLKTIAFNGAIESKKVKVKNWGQELDFFESSDINRPAWKDSYFIENSNGLVIYKAKYPELKMREMIVNAKNKKVKWIIIYNDTKNLLYQTTEKLSFFPDSLYLIEKEQKISLLGANVYMVKGIIGR